MYNVYRFSSKLQKILKTAIFCQNSYISKFLNFSIRFVILIQSAHYLTYLRAANFNSFETDQHQFRSQVLFDS